MGYSFWHYAFRRQAFRRSHWLTKVGLAVWLAAFLTHQWFLRTTPEAQWNSPASKAWRVGTVDAQILGLLLTFTGGWLRWRRHEQRVAAIKNAKP